MSRERKGRMVEEGKNGRELMKKESEGKRGRL